MFVCECVQERAISPSMRERAHTHRGGAGSLICTVENALSCAHFIQHLMQPSRGLVLHSRSANCCHFFQVIYIYYITQVPFIFVVYVLNLSHYGWGGNRQRFKVK